MKRFLLLALFALLLPLAGLQARELPSQAEVEAAVRAGHYSQAEALMQEVVQAKPASAKARYVYAEILAHNRQYAAAQAQLKEARRLDPATGYADPARVQAFEQQLGRAVAQASRPGALEGTGAVIGTGATAPGATAPGGATQATPAPATSPTLPANPPRSQAAPTKADDDEGFPGWLLIGGGLVIAFLVVRALVRRERQVPTRYVTQPGDAWGQQAGTMGGMVPPGTVGTGGGSALRTGMAVAGGVAAGMVLERMLHGNEAHAAQPGGMPGQGMAPVDYASAGDDLGFERREIDFGRGDGWGGGDVDAGGGDAGGDGGGDGGGW